MYLDALPELLDHTNCAHWIPVHLRDMTEISKTHPDIYKEFSTGHFTVQKRKRIFSSIPIDQAHEQHNALVKGDGGAVGLTDNPSALQRWMIAGPEIARVIAEFEPSENKQVDTCHHDQTASVQRAFARDVCSQDMLVLDPKEIVNTGVVKTVNTVQSICQEQLNAFVKECLVDRTTSIHDTIHRNKLVLFNTTEPKATKGKQQLRSLKCDIELFSRLYIACQTRDGNLEQFFRHENQACPPSLSVTLHLGTKSVC